MTQQLPQQEAPAPVPETKRPTVTLQIVKTKFNAELTKLQYQEALDRFSAMEVTADNIAAVELKLKSVRAFKNTLAGIKEEGKKEAWAECKMWDTAYNDILTPLDQLLVSKSTDLQRVKEKKAAENKKIEDEKKRVDGIKKEIDDFILQTSMTIAASTTTDEIVTIEKLIGSNKANKGRYQEFLPDLVERCNELTPLIKKQKETIKQLADFEKKRKEAEAKGDDRTIMELDEKTELAKHSLTQTQINLQQQAIHQATTPDQIPVVTGQTTEVKWRRQSWKWKVEDIKLLAKKMPQFVMLVPNEEVIDAYLKAKKADGSLEGKDEEVINGLKLYLEKLA